MTPRYPKILISLLLVLVVALSATSLYFYNAERALQSTAIKKPTPEDFSVLIKQDKAVFIDRILSVIENDIVPKTMAGVQHGNKVFGAAILKKSDLSTIVTATNTEAINPLMHGEVTAIFDYYQIPENQRLPASETIFFATHEPCPLCLSSISWGGWDNFFYLFTFEDSKNAFDIPYDLLMLKEVFRDKDGSYSPSNKFWNAWGLRDLIAQTTPEQQAGFNQRVAALQKTYATMSAIYQKTKVAGTSAAVPFK